MYFFSSMLGSVFCHCERKRGSPADTSDIVWSKYSSFHKFVENKLYDEIWEISADIENIKNLDLE